MPDTILYTFTRDSIADLRAMLILVLCGLVVFAVLDLFPHWRPWA